MRGVSVERGIHGDVHGELLAARQRFQRVIRLETVAAAENEVRSGKGQNSQKNDGPDPAALFRGRGRGRCIGGFIRPGFRRGCLRGGRSGALFPDELPHEQEEQDQDRKQDDRQCQRGPPDRQDRDGRNIGLCTGNRKGKSVPEAFAVRLFPASVLPGVDADVFNFIFGRCVMDRVRLAAVLRVREAPLLLDVPVDGRERQAVP